MNKQLLSLYISTADRESKMNRLLMTTCLLAFVVAASSTPELLASPSDHPRYAFNYAVHDPLTRDKKAQWETRDGGAVKGSYSLIEPDGSLRVVDYKADDLTGFNAVVKKIGPTVHSIEKVPLVPHLPLINPIMPLSYGFGAAPLALDLPQITSLGPWSLPWDPITHSYGGWVPLPASLPYGPYATIISKKYDGKGRIIGKRVLGPIPIGGKKLVFRKKH